MGTASENPKRPAHEAASSRLSLGLAAISHLGPEIRKRPSFPANSAGCASPRNGSRESARSKPRITTVTWIRPDERGYGSGRRRNRRYSALRPPCLRGAFLPHGSVANITSLDVAAPRSSVTVKNQIVASRGGAFALMEEPWMLPRTVCHCRLLIGPVSVV